MQKPFFILGSGRCGSTLLYRILCAHPRIALTNEARVLEHLYFAGELANIDSEHHVTLVTEEEVRLRGIVHKDYVATYTKVFERHAPTVCEAFYKEYFAAKDYLWWGDKLPDLRAAIAARWLWPASRFVVLVRDPRDVLCSWRAFAERETIATKHPGLVQLPAEQFATTWSKYYEAVATQIPEPLVLSYVDLCRDPKAVTERVLQMLGLDWTFELSEALPAAAGDTGHRTTETVDRSIGRYLTDLPEQDIRIIQDVCGPMMARFGVPQSGDTPSAR